jgi:integrase
MGTSPGRPHAGRRTKAIIGAIRARGQRTTGDVSRIGCGLRHAELLALRVESIRQREEYWVIADLVGKGGHVRTIPIPICVKSTLDARVASAASTHGPVFRAINRAARVWAA